MSYGYLIDSMVDEKHFEINVDVFITRLKKQWPDAEFQSTSYGKVILTLKLTIEGHSMRVNVWANRETVSLEGGSDRSIAEFAVWYRIFVPSEYRLFLYSGPRFNNPILLEKDSAVDDLVKILSN